MRADLLLCDHAEAVNGKLYVNGGGWSMLYAANRPATIYLAIVVTVDWDETNTPHEITAELQTLDGESVNVQAEAPMPVKAVGRLEVGRPPGIKPGTSFPASLALGFANLLLDAGQYVWLVKADGRELTRKAFQVVPLPHLPGFPIPPG